MLLTLVYALIAAAVGIAIGYIVRKQVAQGQVHSAEAKAEKILIEAKSKASESLLEAKEKSITLIDEAKQEEKARREEIKQVQTRLEKREEMFDQKLIALEEGKTKLEQKNEEIQKAKEHVDSLKEDITVRLQEVSGYGKDQALDELLKRVEEDSKLALQSRIQKLQKDGDDELAEKARRIMIDSMQRCAANHANENTGTVINLPSDEMKGRIIGKEGRNIKTLEKITGCELIIDDTPGMLIISGFSPIRRRVCQLTLEKLIKDGRIQPAKIEEYVEEAKRDLALDLKKSGEEALYEMGITGLDPKLVGIVGRLKYRTSYGQNVLNHSKEVGLISAMIAEEVGIDPALAKKAGFFHDIGKAIDHETQGAHTVVGEKILNKFGLAGDIAEVALTHHDTNPPLLLTKLVMAADAISASRTGARRDTHEQYVMRLEELEKTASDFPGIEKVYALSAGREVRVFVRTDEVDDYAAYNLAKDIARKVENELTYPGEIKVNVIRENRCIEYAR